MWKVFPMAVAVMLTTTAMRAQETPDAAVVQSGRALFATYCASCHGIGGRGNGPAAEELRRRPADLTQFAKRNGGVFNGARIHNIVDGRAVKTGLRRLRARGWPRPPAQSAPRRSSRPWRGRRSPRRRPGS